MQVSLQALKAFEAAARRGSFKLAAEELSLTPTAISHHVSNLESRLNVNLFHRRGRRISLSGAGLKLAQALSDGFRIIDNALDELMEAGSSVRVTTTSSLAAMVLIPYQHQFEEANPDISVEISTGEAVDSQSYIIPVRFGDASVTDGANILSHELFDVFGAYEMASPNWSEDTITLFTTEWKNKALPDPPLEAWLKVNGLDRSQFKVKKFDQEFFGIQEAVLGNGLVFCSTTLTKGLVEANRLKQFGTRSVDSGLCYYVPNRAGYETKSAFRFLSWLESVLNR